MVRSEPTKISAQTRALSAVSSIGLACEAPMRSGSLHPLIRLIYEMMPSLMVAVHGPAASWKAHVPLAPL